MVSKLVSDHTKTVRRRNSMYASNPEMTDTQVGAYHDNTARQLILSDSDHQSIKVTEKVELAESHSPQRISKTSSKRFSSSNRDSKRNGFPALSLRSMYQTSVADGHQEATSATMTSVPKRMLQRTSINASSIRHQLNNADGAIHITNTTAPSRRLLLPLVEMQSTLQEMNQRIMSGLGVDETDWMTLRQRSVDLGQMFNNQVIFQWESSPIDTAASNQHFDVNSNVRTMSVDTLNESDHEGECDNDDADLDNSTSESSLRI